MALADRLDTTPRRLTGKPCSVGDLEDYLTGDEADAFRAMLYELGWSGSRIYRAVQDEARVLREAGDLEAAEKHAAMAEQTVNRHRSRSCRCFKGKA